jgi:hypothetical protein
MKKEDIVENTPLSCSRCIHECHLINQGYHWCELQKKTYPKVCEDYADTLKGVTITTN